MTIVNVMCRVSAAIIVAAAVGACASEGAVDEPLNEAPQAIDGSVQAAGLGIPYWTCVAPVITNCNETKLDQSGIDPMNNLSARAACESGWCRAYYATGKVCLHGDTIKCGKGGVGVQGTATCNNGSWGPCL